MAADRRCHLPLWEAAVQARPAEVLAQGLGIFGVAGGPGLASSEGDTAGWHLMNESLPLRPPRRPAPRLHLPHAANRTLPQPHSAPCSTASTRTSTCPPFRSASSTPLPESPPPRWWWARAAAARARQLARLGAQSPSPGQRRLRRRRPAPPLFLDPVGCALLDSAFEKLPLSS